jgi:anti-sigma factor RsiW
VADPREPHAEHDPLVIASLLDRDLGAEERAAAESLIASCASCAALHADLLALSTATQAYPTPARTRGFTLTVDDAARLAGETAGEPGAATARLGGVMTDPSTASDHAVHDTMLVSSLADHSLADGERAAAEALVAACGQCADLHADLLALRAATRAMPTPARPNDYMLTARDAVRLRSGGWRRFVAILGTSRDALSRPLAVGLTTLGLAGLLVANISSFSFASGGATSAPILAPVGGAAGDTSGGSRTLDASAAAEAAASAAPGGGGEEGGGGGGGEGGGGGGGGGGRGGEVGWGGGG